MVSHDTNLFLNLVLQCIYIPLAKRCRINHSSTSIIIALSQGVLAAQTCIATPTRISWSFVGCVILKEKIGRVGGLVWCKSMDSLEDSGYWDFLDYSFIDQAPPDFLWSNNTISVSTEVDIPGDAAACQENTKKRGHADSSCKVGSKACREKLRRERLNERFCDLSSVLEPGRPVRTDKPAILDDAIRVLSQLKTEAQELKKTNEKLLEEIKCLKAEKNELREEKLVLKADKERIEKQLKALPVAPAGYMTPPVAAAAYQAGVNKMALYPNYGYIPMWQYLPQSVRDTSHDHELRPPAA